MEKLLAELSNFLKLGMASLIILSAIVFAGLAVFNFGQTIPDWFRTLVDLSAGVVIGRAVMNGSK